MLATGITFQKTVSKSFDLTLMHQDIFNQNVAELWISSLDFGAGYRITSKLKLELHYRFSQFRNLDNRYEPRNLFYTTLAYGRTYGKWSILLRSRLQSLVYGGHFDDQYKGPIWYSRNRLNVKYRVNYYWQPFVSFEVHAPTNLPHRKHIDQIRYACGLIRHFSDRTRLELYVQRQQQVGRINPRINEVAGVNLYHEF